MNIYIAKQILVDNCWDNEHDCYSNRVINLKASTDKEKIQKYLCDKANEFAVAAREDMLAAGINTLQKEEGEADYMYLVAKISKQGEGTITKFTIETIDAI